MARINLYINHETDKMIEEIANVMGSSKKDVQAFAFMDILERQGVSRERIDKLNKEIHLNYRTTMTVKESFSERINGLNRHGMSKSRFFGLLICDYFNRKGYNIINDEKESATGEHDFSVMFLDEEKKKNQ